MTRRGGTLALAASLAIFCLCAGLVGWRLMAHRPAARPEPAKVVERARAPLRPRPPPVAKLSTIIDLPGDPVLVRRGAVSAPKELRLAVPSKLVANAPKLEVPSLLRQRDAGLDGRRLHGEVPRSRPGGRRAGRPARDEFRANGRRGRRRADRRRRRRRRRRRHARRRAGPDADERQQQPARGRRRRRRRPAAAQADDPEDGRGGKDRRPADRQRLRRGQRARRSKRRPRRRSTCRPCRRKASPWRSARSTRRATIARPNSRFTRTTIMSARSLWPRAASMAKAPSRRFPPGFSTTPARRRTPRCISTSPTASTARACATACPSR